MSKLLNLIQNKAKTTIKPYGMVEIKRRDGTSEWWEMSPTEAIERERRKRELKLSVITS